MNRDHIALTLISRLLPLALLVGLAAAATASASHNDPQKKLTKADNARARAMVLRPGDFGPGVQTQPNGEEPHVTCSALSESDLTVTGEADSPSFVRGFTVYGSSAVVYRTVADARTGWKRSVRPAGIRCVESMYRREYAKQGLTLESFERRSFPRVSDDVIAYRAVLTHQSQGMTGRVTLDLVGLRHTRAYAGFVVGSVVPPSKAEVLRLARMTARRMATAMRGA
jgi:hypothetical protein